MNEANTTIQGPDDWYVPHAEFRAGLPYGRFRVIVNPELAQKYMKRRLFVIGISGALLVLGLIIGLSGYTWIGLGLLLPGILLSRFVKTYAPKILLHMATSDPVIYREAIDNEIMEVRRIR